MSSSHIKRIRLLATITVFALLIGGTIIAIKFAQGYRPSFKKNLSLSGTGLLSVTSYPKSAQVYINDRLTTVTDDTLYLVPDTYQVKIVKTGFQPWSKSLPIKAELVTLTDARLFPSIPSISPLTFYQASNPTVSPDGNKLAYVLTGSPFPAENGVYILSLANTLLGNQITQIADQSGRDYTKADLTWSPDGTQILASFHENGKILASFLLNVKSFNQTKNLVDATVRLPQILDQWQDQIIKINQSYLEQMPDFMVKIASEAAANVYFSLDHEKFFYTATMDQNLPENAIGKALPSINPASEQRHLTAGKTYVYDSKEGTNYQIEKATYNPDTAVPFLTTPTTADNFIKLLPSPTPAPKIKTVPTVVDPLIKRLRLLKAQSEPLVTQNLSWYPTNRHLVIGNPDGVAIIEYDGNNFTSITSTPLTANFTVASPDGNRLVILSNFNQKPDTDNLFSLDLK